MEIKQLVAIAAEAKEKAYVPYSKFMVGAALQTKKGVFSGANIENASYSLCMCAERTALFQAVNAGCRKGDFESITVIANTKSRIVPCGACLQALSEFVERDTPVYLSDKKENFTVYKFSDLLPVVFNFEDEDKEED